MCVWLREEEITMPVHVDNLQSTVEIQADHDAPASPPPAPDETAERQRHEQYQCDLHRLLAEGYAD
jgi:hypothetical protein